MTWLDPSLTLIVIFGTLFVTRSTHRAATKRMAPERVGRFGSTRVPVAAPLIMLCIIGIGLNLGVPGESEHPFFGRVGFGTIIYCSYLLIGWLSLPQCLRSSDGQ